MINEKISEATCETCGRVFKASVKRYYCSHCNKYFYVCPSCAEAEAKCRFCGVPLKRKTEPQPMGSIKRRQLQRV